MPCGSILYDFVGYIRELGATLWKDHTQKYMIENKGNMI